MRGTYPITNQGQEGTCYAHAVTRSLFRLLRLLGISEDPGVFDRIRDRLIDKLGRAGASVNVALKNIVLGEDGFPSPFPADVLDFFLIHVITVKIGADTSRMTTSTRDKIKTSTVFSPDGSLPDMISQALRKHHEPVFTFQMKKNQFAALSSFKHLRPLRMSDIPAGNATAMGAHAVVLTQSGGAIRFKNSWGDAWANGGYFEVETLKVLLPPDGLIQFFDIEIDEARLPQRYRDAIASFETRRVELLPEVADNAITFTRLIGTGTNAVYEGTFVGNKVAVKILSKTEAEVDSLKELKFTILHKNIVELKAFSTSDSTDVPGRKRVKIAMHYSTRGSLSSYFSSLSVSGSAHDVSQGGRLGWTSYFNILMDICEGLDHLHDLRLVHGDLCDCNVVLDSDFTAKLTDFGSISLMDTLSASPGGGHLQWMGPELLAWINAPSATAGSCRDFLPKSDIYSLGRMMEYLLGGMETVVVYPACLSVIINDCKAANPFDRPDVKTILSRLIAICREGSLQPSPVFSEARQRVNNSIFTTFLTFHSFFFVFYYLFFIYFKYLRLSFPCLFRSQTTCLHLLRKKTRSYMRPLRT